MGCGSRPCARAKPLAARYITHSKFNRAAWIDYRRLRLPVRLGDAEPDHVPIEDEVAIAAFFHTNGIASCPTTRVLPAQRSDTAAEQPA
jgi:hypothetical protein